MGRFPGRCHQYHCDWLLSRFPDSPLAPNVILVSALLAIAGFSGDVVISAIKRDKGIKDMGNSVPGHGGVFDRIDSLFLHCSCIFSFSLLHCILNGENGKKDSCKLLPCRLYIKVYSNGYQQYKADGSAEP